MKGPYRHGIALVFLMLVTAAAAVAASYGGAVRIPPDAIWGILQRALGRESVEVTWPGSWETILLSIRFPRVILAGLAGAALAASGATYQGLFQNPMADPFVIGVSAGAAVGAAATMAAGYQHMLGGAAVPVAAFAGAVLTVTVVYLLARTDGRTEVLTLLLAGVAMSALLSGVVSLMIFLSGQQMRAIVYWTMGGFGGADWGQVRIMLACLIIGLIPVLLYSRYLNAMLFGDETAYHLGVDVQVVRRRLLLAASLMAAGTVAVGGIIGFVGLIVPHIVRLVIGPDHRFLLPVSLWTGAPFLILADLTARTVMVPSELPVGILTSILGGPFFLYLLVRHRRGG